MPQYEVTAAVTGHGITHRFTGSVPDTDPPTLHTQALRDALRKSERHEGEPPGEDAADKFPKVAGKCPNCRRESLYLAGGHLTCSFLGCGAPTLADEVLHDGVEEHAHELRRRAESAEARCVRAAHAVDVRDHHARDLVQALTGGGHGLPWWMQATRSLESLDDLANSAELADDSEPLEATLQRVGEMARNTVSD
jgi:hypothetical protein